MCGGRLGSLLATSITLVACAQGQDPSSRAQASPPARAPSDQQALGFVDTPVTRSGPSNQAAPASARGEATDEEAVEDADEEDREDMSSEEADSAGRRASAAAPSQSTWSPPSSIGRGGATALPSASSGVSRWRAVKLLHDAFKGSGCAGGVPGGPGLERAKPAYWEDKDEQGEFFDATRRGAVVLTYHSWHGNGVTADHDVEIARYDTRSCTREDVTVSVSDGGLSARLYGDPSSRVVTQAVGRTLDPGAPEHAYARLVSTMRMVCEPADTLALGDPVPTGDDLALFELHELPFTEQPWHKGRPRAQGWAWYPVEGEEYEGEAVRTRVIAAPGAVKTLRRVGRHEVFGAALHGRNGGFALGVYDRVKRRHRWVMLTRVCLRGTSISWLAAGEELVVGYAVSHHPVYAEEGRDGLFVLDLRRGRAFRLTLEGNSLVWEACPPGELDRRGEDEEEDAEEDADERCEDWLIFEPTDALIGRFRHDDRTLRARSGALVSLARLREALDRR